MRIERSTLVVIALITTNVTIIPTQCNLLEIKKNIQEYTYV
jgi:hypothetical protein